MITLSGIGSVSFRNPDLASKYTIDTGAIIRLTRGQKVIVYRNTFWKSIETEILAFKDIDAVTRQNIETFFLSNRGLEIGIASQRADDCGVEPYTFKGYIYSDIIDYTTTAHTTYGTIYAFGLVLLYKILPSDLTYLIAQNNSYLITQAGDRLTTETV
jgi:hypothetical protein